MTQQEKQQYIDDLVKSKGAGLSGVESSTYKHVQECTAAIQQLGQNLQQLNQQVTNAQITLEQTRGSLTAYTEVLLLAEKDRRETAHKGVDATDELSKDWTPESDEQAVSGATPPPDNDENKPAAETAAN